MLYLFKQSPYKDIRSDRYKGWNRTNLAIVALSKLDLVTNFDKAKIHTYYKTTNNFKKLKQKLKQALIKDTHYYKTKHILKRD